MRIWSTARFWIGLWLVTLAPLLAESAQTDATRPNIVLVFIDDMGWADFSCFGNTDAQTPHIDRLAEEGVRFEQFYVNSPICSPSRVAISTGQYPQRWRITSFLNHRQSNEERGMAQWLDPQAPMLARRLKQAGYATGHFGKWHMGGQRDVGEAPLISEYGFDKSVTNFEGLGERVLPLLDAYDGSPVHRHALGSDNLGRGPIRWEQRDQVTARFVDAAIDFIDEAAKNDTPFYINLWPDDVHSPFFPPGDRRGNGSKRDRYLGVLETMDEQLAPLFERIRADQRLQSNTAILICSDNGPEEGAGSAGAFRGHKATLYEGGIRSPLIVWAPGRVAEPGEVNKSSVFAAFDLVPTLLAIAGVDPPRDVQFDGAAMPEVLLGKSDESRPGPLFFRRPPDRPGNEAYPDLPDLAVRDGRWKLLCEYDGSRPQLYDLSSDPGESHNLADKRPKIVKRLTKAVVAWHKEMPPDNGANFPLAGKSNARRRNGK